MLRRRTAARLQAQQQSPTSLRATGRQRQQIRASANWGYSLPRRKGEFDSPEAAAGSLLGFGLVMGAYYHVMHLPFSQARMDNYMLALHKPQLDEFVTSYKAKRAAWAEDIVAELDKMSADMPRMAKQIEELIANFGENQESIGL